VEVCVVFLFWCVLVLHIEAAQNKILALIACVRVHGLSHTLKQNGHT